MIAARLVAPSRSSPNTLICTAVANRQTDFTPARNRRAHNSTYKAELMIAVGVSDIQVSAQSYGHATPAYLHRAVTRKWFRDGRKGDSAEGAGI